MSILGRAFDWESLSIMMTTPVPLSLSNIKSVDWSDTRGITPTYGAGGAPHGYGRRNYRAQGSMEVADETYAALLTAAAVVGGIYNLIFSLNLKYGSNPYSVGYDKIHNTILNQCIMARRGGASRQGVSEARIIRLEFEILGGVTDLALSELAAVL
jgi:hypothetical protein